jgi:hypothetical protein
MPLCLHDDHDGQFIVHLFPFSYPFACIKDTCTLDVCIVFLSLCCHTGMYECICFRISAHAEGLMLCYSLCTQQP